MKSQSKQVPFDLKPTKPYSLSYFVTHSGVVEAWNLLEKLFSDFQEKPKEFAFCYLWAHAGLGKTHLVQGLLEQVKELNPQIETSIAIYDAPTSEPSDEWVSEFVHTFNTLKANGGLMLILSRKHPDEVTDNPHVKSRLHSGMIVRILPPKEEELVAIVHSILERKNLQLSERSIEYLRRRLPNDPLSFDEILASINQLSLEESRPASLKVIREAIESNHH